MDQQRFDTLTKAFAQGTVSRRGVVRGLLAGGAALVGLRRASGPAAARGRPCAAGRRCASDDDCCGRDRCNNGGHCAPALPAQTECSPSQQCAVDDDCCQGEGCVDGKCGCAGTRCTGVCTDLAVDELNCGACGTVCADAPVCQTPICSDSACDATPDATQDGLVCAAGKVCASGACLTAQGGACAADAECASLTCADGVCCDTACTGQCEACNLADTGGTCLPFAGLPVAHDRPFCNGVGTACSGFCDGSTRDACTYPTDATICDLECVDGDLAVRFCDGAGNCSIPGVSECGLFVCREAACVESCQSNEDCVAGAFCNASTGSCAPLQEDGTGCASADQCASGVCFNDSCGCPSGLHPCDGTCRECCSSGDCTDEAEAVCFEGSCICRGPGQVCASSIECCGANLCATNPEFGVSLCCTPKDQPCSNEHQCCPGSGCSDSEAGGRFCI